MLRIPAALDKGNQARLLPLAPDAAEFILAAPEAERVGRVVKLPSRCRGLELEPHRVFVLVAKIGKASGVKVATEPVTGAVKFASAHNLQGSFAERWSQRLMPQVLQELMRHESIETTLTFYTGEMPSGLPKRPMPCSARKSHFK